MKIPAYVRELLRRTEYVQADQTNEFCRYMFRICAPNEYAYRTTFEKDVERFIKWANHQHAQAEVICQSKSRRPIKCSKYDYFIVARTDPVHQALQREGLLPAWG